MPPNAIAVGNPARIVGYVGDQAARGGTGPAAPVASDDKVTPTSVEGVTLHRLPAFADMRGALSVGEFERDLPFLPQRYFVVHDVPSRETRGEHAHRRCHQFLVCVHGSVRVLADDGTHRQEFLLAAPDQGIHLPPMTWGTQYRYSEDAVLLVFASEVYDADEYIRSYDEFIGLRRG